MKCNEVLERLDDHVDGILPVTEAEGIRNHLDACVDCRENALATRAATSSLSSWDDVDPPPECFDEILARIEMLPLPELPPPPAPPRLVNRILAFEPELPRLDGARVRRIATTGLAAAAAVLGALVVTRTDTQQVRRTRTTAPTFQVASSIPGPFDVSPALGAFPAFQDGYELDDGLWRSGVPARAACPAPILVEAAPR